VTLQRRKPVPAHVAFEQVTPRIEDAVLVLSELIVTSRWQTGISTRQYAKLWGVSEAKILEWYRAACATVRVVADPESMQRLLNEGMAHMIGLMYDLKGVDDRGSIAAGKVVIDTCVALLKVKDDGSSCKTEREVFQRLIEMGWTPPRIMPGLPMPSVMDPNAIESTGEQTEPEETPNERITEGPPGTTA
jgi:hypothetical protein